MFSPNQTQIFANLVGCRPESRLAFSPPSDTEEVVYSQKHVMRHVAEDVYANLRSREKIFTGAMNGGPVYSQANRIHCVGSKQPGIPECIGLGQVVAAADGS